jgi:uncharacterized protein (TIGR03435 family)
MRRALFLALVLAALQVGTGQQPGAAQAVSTAAAAPDRCLVINRPSFDVITVKPTQGNSNSSSMRGTPDGVIITSSLRKMVLFAYSLHEFQVTGGPDWVSTSTWEVNAKNDVPDPDFSKLSRAELQALYDRRTQQVQAMLMDRFRLQCHMTTKELPVYEMVQAKGGAKLKATAAEVSKQNSSSSIGHGLQMHETATGVTTARIASLLTNEVDQLVVDKTGLTGIYDLTLDWVHDAPSGSADATTGPTIFTALEEQLGLKLVPAKDPVPVLVIDGVAKPSED